MLGRCASRHVSAHAHGHAHAYVHVVCVHVVVNADTWGHVLPMCFNRMPAPLLVVAYRVVSPTTKGRGPNATSGRFTDITFGRYTY